ncbi:Phosphoribosylglycinamide synthetase, ATP-grasp (A) domain [Kushneria avicenniae]|uniref:Phosphoribosylglycinamide synthetase, ATP-grasp (A) domain n=1 Tax=Kushneria avicenniae TaxID=402385 RepID=A0A1I1FH33_9GAMM|nr:hypothetical protein [Kushneria avicenniae]SFB96443.1 Phosphoribosylglycinamide synthetase, ATP-grasp (A) domain [Kushneria avicenniae]
MSRKSTKKKASSRQLPNSELSDITLHANELLVDIKRLFDKGMDETADPTLELLLALDPTNAEALYFQGRRQAKKGQIDYAINSLTTASFQLPDRPSLYWLLAMLYTQKQQDRGAISALHRFLSMKPDDKNAIWHLAALYSTNGYSDHSEFWLKRAIRANPVNLATDSETKRLNVLVLKTARETTWSIDRKEFTPIMTEGHNNLPSVLDNQNIALSYIYVDEIQKHPEVLRRLSKIDLIYNNITDAERCEAALEKAAWICKRLQRPVVNPPSAVLAASREQNYARFKDESGIIQPLSVRIDNIQGNCRDIIEPLIAEHGLKLPLIVRLAGFQGGRFMHKVHDLARHDFSDIDRELAKKPQTLYLIQYHAVDYQSEKAPGIDLYPKYRAFIVGGSLYPVHLFTANSFNVHKSNADPVMEAHPWLIEQERDYCQDPAEHLGRAQWEGLEAIMQKTGLDYAGVDFAPATSPEDSGRLVIFEINPAMRNWVDGLPEGDHVQAAWHIITRAAHHLFATKADVPEWEFIIPAGHGESLKIPAEVICKEKIRANDSRAQNQAWLTHHLEEPKDFSAAPFFDLKHYIDEEILTHEATSRGIELIRRPSRMLEFTKGRQQVVFHINAPRVPIDVHLMERDKLLVKELLRRNGLPTPAGEAFIDFQSGYGYFAQCKRPQVVKPSDGFASRGVTIDVTTPAQFRNAWQKAKKVGRTVIIEDMIQGEEIRLYFHEGEFVEARLRAPAFIIGNGANTVAELIEAKNTYRAKNPVTIKGLIQQTPVLEKAGRCLDDIPAKGEWVELGEGRMVAMGSDNLPLKVDESVLEMATRAAHLLPSRACGVDMFVEELEHSDGVWFTEINSSTPNISAFHFPSTGLGTALAKRLLTHAFETSALPVTPQKGALLPARRCQPISKTASDFSTSYLHMIACAHNLFCVRLEAHSDALLIGAPAQLGWIEGVSTHTALESVEILKHTEWLQERLQKFDIPSDEPNAGMDIKVLMAGSYLLAAHAMKTGGWEDVTESLHEDIADVAARAMQAIYSPGHALLTLKLASLERPIEANEWALKFVDLQPDLSVFYSGIDRPRDVISGLLSVWWPDYEHNVTQPIVQQLKIMDRGQHPEFDMTDWLNEQINLHVLEGHYQMVEPDILDIHLEGQPNAIKTLLSKFDSTPFIERL